MIPKQFIEASKQPTFEYNLYSKLYYIPRTMTESTSGGTLIYVSDKLTHSKLR